jgi:hypothetical protein
VSIFRPTVWKFVTSGGAEVDIGVSKFLFAAFEGGAFYAQQDGDSTIYRLPFVGAGGGAGVGVSAGGVVSLSVSMPFQPGGGFRIYSNPLRFSGTVGLQDFAGPFVAITGAGAVGFSGSISAIAFGAPSILVNLISMAPLFGLAGRIDATILACAGFGAIWGSAETSAAGVSATVYTGQIFAPTQAAPGETG